MEAIYFHTLLYTLNDVSEVLSKPVPDLYAEGSTALYDAVCVAVEQAAALKAEDERGGEKRLYGVVVLSDGQDTASTRTLNQMFACLPASEDAQGIKVFTIADGDDAVDDLLLRIANRSQGKAFARDPETIGSVYVAIVVEQ